MTAKYPVGYGTTTMSMEVLRARFEGPMHPEYARRLFAWIEHMDGAVGIGSAWRKNPDPISYASRMGWSFHQDQKFASGFVGIAAIDAVAQDGPDANFSHDGMTSGLAATAVPFGLHANIGLPGQPGYEAWHIQPLELDGYKSWVARGRPDPVAGFVLPGTPKPTPKPPEVPVAQIKLFKFDDDPPLFAQIGGVLAIWVSGPQLSEWLRLGIADLDKIVKIKRSEAARFTFVGGDAPLGYGNIWANSERV